MVMFRQCCICERLWSPQAVNGDGVCHICERNLTAKATEKRIKASEVSDGNSSS